MAAIDPNIRLRPATLADIPLLEAWDHEPHVMAASSDREQQDSAFDGRYWLEELARIAPDYQYFIADRDGRPIGALLIIDPATEASHYWGMIEPNLRAIDIWIGAASDLGKGYGETMMRRALQLCFATPNLAAIVIDPLASNVRAHRFYQRLGFVPEARRQFADSDCLVHRLTRDIWRARFPQD
jgi:aminoglycoside 6'-N-acetyltransferase